MEPVEGFSLGEARAGDTVVLSARGELDIAAAEGLQQRLSALSASHQAVRLDLAELDFIDSTGVSCIAQAVREASRDGWDFTVGRELRPQVRRVIELIDGETLFWPPDGSLPR